eukprot:9418451-Pyramimonas_sp.AAC.1
MIKPRKSAHLLHQRIALNRCKNLLNFFWKPPPTLITFQPSDEKPRSRVAYAPALENLQTCFDLVFLQ